MPSLTLDQIRKYNEKAGQGFQLDTRACVFSGEKELYHDTELDNGDTIRLVLCYKAEREGEGWSAKNTGRQLPTVSVQHLSPIHKGDEASLCRINFLSDVSTGEPQARKMFNYLLKLSHSIDIEQIVSDAKKQINPEIKEISILDFVSEDQTETEETEEAEEMTTEQTVTTDQEANIEIRETDPISVGSQFVDAEGKLYTVTSLDHMQVILNGGEQAMIDFGTRRTVGDVLRSLFDGSKCIYNPLSTGTEQAAEDETEDPTEDPESSERDDLDKADTPDDEDTQEATKAAQDLTETAQEDTPQETAPPADDMFATFAAAYINNQTVPTGPKTPQEARDDDQTDKQSSETKNAVSGQNMDPEEPQEDTTPGYHGETSQLLTPDQIATLENGGQVIAPGSYRYSFYFTAIARKGVRIVYKVGNYEGMLSPTATPENVGYIIGGKLYTHYTRDNPIDEKLVKDVSRAVREKIPDEKTAKALYDAADVGEWAKKDIGYILENAEKRAIDDFYNNTTPQLTLYHGKHETSVLIKYLLDPEITIEALANGYIRDYPEKIYTDWAAYNRTMEALEKVNSDKSRIEHKIKRIVSSIGDEKTVRVKLANGNTVRVEAIAVKWLKSNHDIYNSRVLAADRHLLEPNENGHGVKDIAIDDIVAVYHGQKVLYTE